MFTVVLHHLVAGTIKKVSGLSWNDAQHTAAEFRRLPEKPASYWVEIKQTATYDR